MTENQRRRLAGQPVSMTTPPDRRRAVEHYTGLAREAEIHRLQAEQDKLIDVLLAINQRIKELRSGK